MNMMTPVEHAHGYGLPITLPLLPMFTPRQQDVVRMVAHGFEDKEIAHAMGVAPSTVKMHIRMAYERMGINNRVHLTLVALGLMAPPKLGPLNALLSSIQKKHKLELCMEYTRKEAEKITEKDIRWIGEDGTHLRDLWHQMQRITALRNAVQVVPVSTLEKERWLRA